jgi:fused signal recognition particle receptor
VFSKLREVLKSFTQRVAEVLRYRELSEKEIEEFCEKLFVDLVEADVAVDVAQTIVELFKEKLKNVKVPRGSNTEDIVVEVAKDIVLELLERGEAQDPVLLVKDMLRQSKPVKIIFVGVNGVGKTTTIAKVAYKLIQNSLKPVIVAADTFRAGAQEQLKKHSLNLGVAFIGGRYGADPAAVAYDGINFAKKHGLDVVLIDTAGRMHVDVDLMNELRKIVKVVNPNLKILILDALTGNDAIEQAKLFNEAIGVDGVVLTKVDADAKGGAALSVIVGVGKPIFYLGVGQKYDDLEVYRAQIILERLFK